MSVSLAAGGRATIASAKLRASRIDSSAACPRIGTTCAGKKKKEKKRGEIHRSKN